MILSCMTVSIEQMYSDEPSDVKYTISDDVIRNDVHGVVTVISYIK